MALSDVYCRFNRARGMEVCSTLSSTTEYRVTIFISLNNKSSFCNPSRSTKASYSFIYFSWLCVALNSVVAPNFNFFAVAMRTVGRLSRHDDCRR